MEVIKFNPANYVEANDGVYVSPENLERYNAMLAEELNEQERYQDEQYERAFEQEREEDYRELEEQEHTPYYDNETDFEIGY